MKNRLLLVPIMAIAAVCMLTDSADARHVKVSHSDSSTPTGYVGVSGVLMYWPEVIYSGDGIWNDQGINFSGGVSVIAEVYIIRYLAMGGLVDASFWNPAGSVGTDDLIPQLSIDFSLRPMFPFGSKGQFELYLRAAVGYTAFIPDLDSGVSLSASEHGWNLRLLPGFAWRAGFGLTLSFELGWVASGFRIPGLACSHTMYHSPTFNFGVGYTF